MTPDKRRLDFLDRTLKELFALSGNQCAFPGCAHPVIDEMGQVVAQVAHIVGVARGSARYNESWTPEQLRDSSNLLILCYAHHIATNDEAVYDVARMRGMKSAHERRFNALVSGLRNQVEDKTAGVRFYIPSNFDRLVAAVGLPSGDEFYAEVASDTPGALEKLRRLPPELRSIIAHIIEHGEDTGSGDAWEVEYTHLQLIADVDRATFDRYVTSLTKSGYVHAERYEADENHISPWIMLSTSSRMFHPSTSILPALSSMMHEDGIPPNRIFVTLDWRFMEGR